MTRIVRFEMDIPCEYCGHGPHSAVACSLVKSVEFFPDGSIKKIEKYDLTPFVNYGQTSASGLPEGTVVVQGIPLASKVDLERFAHQEEHTRDEPH